MEKSAKAYHFFDRPLLIGESSHTPEKRPFDGVGGRKIAKMCGLSDLFDFFETTNLFLTLPLNSENGDPFPMAEAKAVAERLKIVLEDRSVFLAGKRVAEAFGILHPVYFEQLNPDWCVRAWIIPHPSGRNRWWNDRENVRKATRFFSSFVKEWKCLEKVSAEIAANR